MLLKEKIPTIYHTILSDFLEIQIPDEKIATCSSCTLCKSDKSPYLDIKCCNYFPNMYNYLLGGVLQEKELEFGKNAIREIINSKVGTTPYGIVPGKKFTNRQNTILKKKAIFSTKEENLDQKCPYYDDGRCSVWKYRESLCVTFYCASIAGKVGDDFWSKFNQFLKLTEKKLSQYALLKLSWESENINLDFIDSDSFNFEDLTNEIDLNLYDKLWEEWNGREEELYIKSFNLVKSLTKEDFISILGQDYELYKSSILLHSEEFGLKVYPKFLKLNSELTFEVKKGGKLLLKLNQTEVVVELVFLPFIKKFNGSIDTVTIFHLAFEVLLGMNSVLDKMIENDMLKINN
jgi:hypothetical protein